MFKTYTDTGKFRAALYEAGYRYAGRSDIEGAQIFNDRAKSKGFRKLKLWLANEITESSPKQRAVLDNLLQKAFGNRLISIYEVNGPKWDGHDSGLRSLCIKLKA